MSNQNTTNIGGINGLGESLINTNSLEFRALKNMIHESFQSQSEEERIANSLLSIRFQMETYINASIALEDLIVPGFFVEKLLEAVHVTKKQLAAYVHYEYTNLIALIKGRRKINSDLAIKLGQIFGIDPVIWLHIESKNELIQALSSSKQTLSLQGLLNKAS